MSKIPTSGHKSTPNTLIPSFLPSPFSITKPFTKSQSFPSTYSRSSVPNRSFASLTSSALLTSSWPVFYSLPLSPSLMDDELCKFLSQSVPVEQNPSISTTQSITSPPLNLTIINPTFQETKISLVDDYSTSESEGESEGESESDLDNKISNAFILDAHVQRPIFSTSPQPLLPRPFQLPSVITSIDAVLPSNPSISTISAQKIFKDFQTQYCFLFLSSFSSLIVTPTTSSSQFLPLECSITSCTQEEHHQLLQPQKQSSLSHSIIPPKIITPISNLHLSLSKPQNITSGERNPLLVSTLRLMISYLHIFRTQFSFFFQNYLFFLLKRSSEEDSTLSNNFNSVSTSSFPTTMNLMSSSTIFPTHSLFTPLYRIMPHQLSYPFYPPQLLLQYLPFLFQRKPIVFEQVTLSDNIVLFLPLPFYPTKSPSTPITSLHQESSQLYKFITVLQTEFKKKKLKSDLQSEINNTTNTTTNILTQLIEELIISHLFPHFYPIFPVALFPNPKLLLNDEMDKLFHTLLFQPQHTLVPSPSASVSAFAPFLTLHSIYSSLIATINTVLQANGKSSYYSSPIPHLSFASSPHQLSTPSFLTPKFNHSNCIHSNTSDNTLSVQKRIQEQLYSDFLSHHIPASCDSDQPITQQTLKQHLCVHLSHLRLTIGPDVYIFPIV